RAVAPEPLAFEPEDSGATQAIPTLVRPFAAPAAPAAEPQPAPPPPFAFDEEEPAAPAVERERADAVVFETFPPSPEPEGVTEDTNPAFFERRPAGAPAPVEFPSPAERASTASFPPPEGPADPASYEITAPMAFPALEEAVGPEAPPPAEEPEPVPAAPPPPPEPPSPPASSADAAAERLDRMIQLAVASTWGDRLSAAEEKLAAGDALADRVAALEAGLASHGETPARLGELDRRLAAAEGSRGWMKDVDLLRTDWTNARLAADERMAELKRALSEVAQSLAEASGREMELVAQVSREALSTAAAFEKLGFRIQEIEEKFGQLAVDQESRLARVERLVEEQNGRATADRESSRRSLLELEERLRGVAAEADDHRRRAAGEIEETVRHAREELERQRAIADELRGSLGDGLADLAARLRGTKTPSS
ncbi:MAG TPA: hypothetical protein VG777_03805, partial [Thermoanaerobaculia bacterium]|nr:hypothetical protein [Thermoanaerobaculia bacterium]